VIRQLTLDLSPTIEGDSSLSQRVTYDDIHVSQSTFINGLANSVHRWFRLTPSFGPDLVREMMDRLVVGKGNLILDPFAGAGTTLIEAKLEGRDSIGFEVNPLLHFVNETSLCWDIKLGELKQELRRIERDFEQARAIQFEELETNGLSVPLIHNPTRWWRPDVLVSLLVLKRAILATQERRTRAFLLLSLAGCLIPDLTNVTLGRLQLHFIERRDKIDVWATYRDHTEKMIFDLKMLQDRINIGESRCYLQNATDLSNFKPTRLVDAVITSPPYPNRYSYVWNTRPHLYLLDFFTTAKEASDLDRTTIGGTWGTATSELAKNTIAPLNSAVEWVIGPVADQIREKDNLMANYVMHYFNRLALQILQMQRILSAKNSIAYVVGNSWIKDVYIETDLLLGEILERLGLGYDVFDIHRFRRRHSGVELYESIVYARKR
jgi:DNA modification methylase